MQRSTLKNVDVEEAPADIPAVFDATPRRVTRVGGWAVAHHAVREPSRDDDDRTPTTGEHDARYLRGDDGEIVLTWGSDGPVVTAPGRAAVPTLALFGMRRVPGDPRAVELPGGIRYLIGAAHRRWRGAVSLHRLSP